MQNGGDRLRLRNRARTFDSGVGTVEVRMPLGADLFEVRDKPSRAARSGKGRRAAFLLGTSLLVYAATPSAALAQNECGAPPAGPGAVSCPPANNPYLNGITYNGLVDDLTVVLEPAVRVNDTVRMTSSGYYASLSLIGPIDTAIETTGFLHPG